MLDFIAQRSPIIRLEFSVFDPLLAPVLMQLTDSVLRLLEVNQFISYALFDKDTPRVLINDRLFVLCLC